MRFRVQALAVLACLIVIGSGCATLTARYRNPDGSINAVAVISDMRWSVSEACDQEWLPPTPCTVGKDTLALAESLAMKDGPGTLLAARQVVIDAEAKLAPDSRLRPYLDVVIRLMTP